MSGLMILRRSQNLTYHYDKILLSSQIPDLMAVLRWQALECFATS